jgi:hypothetical protein
MLEQDNTTIPHNTIGTVIGPTVFGLVSSGTGTVPAWLFALGLLITSALFVAFLTRANRRAKRAEMQVHDLNAQLARANAAIHEANAKLLERTKKQNQAATEQLQRSRTARDFPQLDPAEVQILGVLANSPITRWDLAANLNMVHARVDYHATRLIDVGYIISTELPSFDQKYQITQKGREYLVYKGLL